MLDAVCLLVSKRGEGIKPGMERNGTNCMGARRVLNQLLAFHFKPLFTCKTRDEQESSGALGGKVK